MTMTKHVCSNNRWALLNLHLACVLCIKPLQALQHTNNSHTAFARLAEFQRKRTQLCSALTIYNQFTVADFPRLQGQRGVMGVLLLLSRVKSFLKATSKIPLPISIRSPKIPRSSCEQTLFQPPFQQLPDTSEHGAA